MEETPSDMRLDKSKIEIDFDRRDLKNDLGLLGESVNTGFLVLRFTRCNATKMKIVVFFT